MFVFAFLPLWLYLVSNLLNTILKPTEVVDPPQHVVDLRTVWPLVERLLRTQRPLHSSCLVPYFLKLVKLLQVRDNEALKGRSSLLVGISDFDLDSVDIPLVFLAFTFWMLVKLFQAGGRSHRKRDLMSE